MDVWFITKIRAVILALLFSISLTHSPNALSQSSLLGEINRLDEDFKSVSSNFYQDKSSYPGYARKKFDDVSKLLSEVDRLSSRSDDINAIRLLYNNESLVMYNVDDKAVFSFLKILLRNNEWNLAHKIFKTIENEGDRSLSATVHFIFANYYADRQEWDKVNHLLEGTITELSTDNAAYGYLLKGVALQHLKMHRESILYYKKVPASSKYYPQAQLNMATASIRLGWWTDADIIVKNLTQSRMVKPNKELYNRLYLVIGYELLQKNYYRNARNAFRKVSLTSRHKNRALLGIGLTAISQGDYIGGVNALTRLKKEQTRDLSVDESYLVLPYVYNKLQQEITATAGYNEAVAYYKERIATLKHCGNVHHEFDSIRYDENSKSLIVNDNSFDYNETFPVSFVKNYRLLTNISKQVINTKQGSKINRLLSSYDRTLQTVIGSLLQKRISYLTSYLSQARYGLAMLFDNSSNGNKPGK